MQFLELRNHYMNEYHWNRRVATLAVGLDWCEVRPLIEAAFADSDTEVQLYV